MKKIVLHIIGILIFCGMLFKPGVPVQAADFKMCDPHTKVGKYYIWRTGSLRSGFQIKISKKSPDDSEGSVLVKIKAGKRVLGIISDGQTVYYAERGSSPSLPVSIYQIKTNKKGKKCIATIEKLSELYGYYNGKLLYEKTDLSNSDFGLYSFDVKTKTCECIMADTDDVMFDEMEQYGKYLVITANIIRNNNVQKDNIFYIYNCASGKQVQITKRGHGFDGGRFFAQIFRNKLYYVENVKKNYARICVCSLTGKNRKKIATVNYKGEDGVALGQVTSKYVYYSKGISMVYRYDLKKKKAKRFYSGYPKWM